MVRMEEEGGKTEMRNKNKNILTWAKILHVQFGAVGVHWTHADVNGLRNGFRFVPMTASFPLGGVRFSL